MVRPTGFEPVTHDLEARRHAVSESFPRSHKPRQALQVNALITCAVSLCCIVSHDKDTH